MKIREHAKEWPPEVASQAGVSICAEAADKVLSVDRYQESKDHIRVRLRQKDGTEYAAILILPDHFYGRALIAIVQAKEITLGELGELGI
jgi:hypothetical protein